tara:strand:+ start:533 stop:850 length:318 start_codon:yes stop_codon:yes gene_type:complete
MKTLYQIIREFYGEKREDYKQVVYTETVYESKQDAESVLLDGLKVKLSEQGWEFRITEVNLFEEVKIEYGSAESEVVRKRILADNAIKIDDAEADDIRNSAFLRS